METGCPMTCPVCGGSGQITKMSEETKRRFLESLDVWASLREKSNAQLAGVVKEIESYLSLRDLSPVVSEFLSEVWWRLHAAEEPIEETQRKMEALSNDPVWLASE